MESSDQIQSKKKRPKEGKKKTKKHQKEKKSKKDKKKHKNREQNAVNATTAPVQLTSEDYYARSTEFRVWLWLKKKKCLDELTSDASHELFEKFIKKWNKHKLERTYYEGIPEETLQTCKRSKHQWAFVSKMTKQDRIKLESAKDSVQVNTITSADLIQNKGAQTVPQKRALVQPRVSEGRAGQDDIIQQDKKRAKQFYSEVAADLIPKSTGKEALIEKRQFKGQSMRGSLGMREDAMDGLDVGEDVLMGGGDGGFQKQLQKRQARKEEKVASGLEKIALHYEQEQAKMKKMIDDLGLKPGQKVTIAPRNK